MPIFITSAVSVSKRGEFYLVRDVCKKASRAIRGTLLRSIQFNLQLHKPLLLVGSDAVAVEQSLANISEHEVRFELHYVLTDLDLTQQQRSHASLSKNWRGERDADGDG